ncbi:MAG: NAD-dependent epimerase/dehydratase family protein, partial [Promethearchaeota archaeon]
MVSWILNVVRILVTGAFGTVGESTLKKLVKQRHEVRCFDIKNSKTKSIKKRLSKKVDFDTYWGNITKREDVNNAVRNQDCIIHLAAIIPPLSERNPELAYNVNVGGTKNLINAAKKQSKQPKLIIASSLAVYGPKMNCETLRCVDEPLYPTDNYSHHKVEIEKLVKESGLPWLILRLAAVASLRFPLTIDPIIYEIPLDQRIEIIYIKDAATAFANAVKTNITNKVLLIGGGKSCQIYQREYAEKMFDVMGISMPPDSAFKIPKKNSDWFYTDWLDTEESQRMLHYQKKNFEDYVKKLRKIYSKRRVFTHLVSPLINYILLGKSPYYK